jgi:hypothetical protein
MKRGCIPSAELAEEGPWGGSACGGRTACEGACCGLLGWCRRVLLAEWGGLVRWSVGVIGVKEC